MLFFPIIEIFLPLILVFTGTLETYLYFMQKRNFEKWPRVAAEVTFCKMYDAPHPFFGRAYEAVIHFRYSFRGEDYVSETPFLKGYSLFSNRRAEISKLNQFQVGDIKTARVNPSLPQFAYFEIAPFNWISSILVPVGALLYLGLVYFIFSVSRYLVGE